MKKILKENVSLIIILVAIIISVYFGYQVISYVMDKLDVDNSSLNFDKISEYFIK